MTTSVDCPEDMRPVRSFLLLLLSLVCLAGDPPELEQIGRLDHPAIGEASGIVQSRRHPGIFWVHNDSGNPPALFAVRRDGSLVREYPVAMPNVDWEDIAIDDSGHLYIGEIGNNGGQLPLRAIYRVDEPDPDQPSSLPLSVTVASYYRFESRKTRFDAESLVVDGRRALVIAKTFDRREAEIYEVPLDPPAPLLRPALAKRLGSLPESTEPATGADLSPDGLLLAVVSERAARVYRKGPEETWTLIGTARFQSDGVEAICWDGSDLILASEGRQIFRIPGAEWRGRR
jgi:hypothetical protein